MLEQTDNFRSILQVTTQRSKRRIGLEYGVIPRRTSGVFSLEGGDMTFVVRLRVVLRRLRRRGQGRRKRRQVYYNPIELVDEDSFGVRDFHFLLILENGPNLAAKDVHTLQIFPLNSLETESHSNKRLQLPIRDSVFNSLSEGKEVAIKININSLNFFLSRRELDCQIHEGVEGGAHLVAVATLDDAFQLAHEYVMNSRVITRELQVPSLCAALLVTFTFSLLDFLCHRLTDYAIGVFMEHINDVVGNLLQTPSGKKETNPGVVKRGDKKKKTKANFSTHLRIVLLHAHELARMPTQDILELVRRRRVVIVIAVVGIWLRIRALVILGGRHGLPKALQKLRKHSSELPSRSQTVLHIDV